jgi:hypothetical protein
MPFWMMNAADTVRDAGLKRSQATSRLTAGSGAPLHGIQLFLTIGLSSEVELVTWNFGEYSNNNNPSHYYSLTKQA